VEAFRTERLDGGLTDVHLKQPFEEPGVELEGVEGRVAD
jgi:hypothetical protein